MCRSRGPCRRSPPTPRRASRSSSRSAAHCGRRTDRTWARSPLRQCQMDRCSLHGTVLNPSSEHLHRESTRNTPRCLGVYAALQHPEHLKCPTAPEHRPARPKNPEHSSERLQHSEQGVLAAGAAVRRRTRGLVPGGPAARAERSPQGGDFPGRARRASWDAHPSGIICSDACAIRLKSQVVQGGLR